MNRRFGKLVVGVAVALIVPDLAADAQERPALRPVTIAVVDAETQKPIREFDYFYFAKAPGYFSGKGYTAGKSMWIPFDSADGLITLDLAQSCELTIGVRAAGYVYDTHYFGRYPIKQDDKDRRITHAIRRGQTIRGVVQDAETSKPISGARVSPTIFRSPSIDADHDRSIFTDDHGRFEISGIDTIMGSSIIVEHDAYFEEHCHEVRPAADVVVKLRAGNTIFGKVQGPDGKFIDGAMVDTGDGRSGHTGPDGRFTIRGVRKNVGFGVYQLGVKKSGFMEWFDTPNSMPDGGFQVTLEPLFEIRGQVLDANGKPVEHFRVAAGPGRNPANYKTKMSSVDNHDGRFSLAIDTGKTLLGGGYADGKHVEPEHWVGIRADGHEVWEGLVPFARNAPPLTVRLSRGVSLSGKIEGSVASFTDVEAIITPDRPTVNTYSVVESGGQAVGSRRTAIANDGSFRFEHLRPARYLLTLSGKGITTTRLTLEVPQKDHTLAPIKILGTGRIEGQVFTREGKPWAFADGVLIHPTLGEHGSQHFKIDENGQFKLDDVPAGEARVGAQYRGGCVIESDLSKVRVVPGETAHAIVNNPQRGNDATFQFDIGDGSPTQFKSGTGMGAKRLVENVSNRPPMFRIELKPLEPQMPTLPDEPDWQTLDSSNTISLPNVAAGQYQVRIFDWLCSRGFRDGLLYDSVIRIDGATPVKLYLGAGAITGQIKVTRQIRRMPQVIAIETKGTTHPRRARCDDSGNFCVRYLPAGSYDLIAHEDANGFRRLAPVRIESDISDVGQHDLESGGVIRGTVQLAGPAAPPTAIRATDARGVSLEALDFRGQNGEAYSISNVWPGEWTISLERGEEVLTTAKTVVRGTESTDVNLITK